MIELIYTSVAQNALSSEDINAILSVSQKNNAHNNITGVLFYDGQRFLQILEGEDNTIHGLFNRIESDARHINVDLLYEQEIGQRTFKNWRMTYERIQAEKLDNPMRVIEAINDEENRLNIPPLQFNYGAKLFQIFADSLLI